DGSRPLAEILVRRGWLPAEQRELVEGLVPGRPACPPTATPPPEAPAAPTPPPDGGLPATLPSPPRPAAPAGARYRVLRPPARGGLGEVFVALDEELNREVALKEIQAHHAHNPDSRARFLLEAAVTGQLEHPGVVPVYGLGVYPDGRP